MNKEKILITGSEGIIGGILTKSLRKKFEIYGLDRKIQNSKNTEWKYFQIDISDMQELRSIFSQLKGKKEKIFAIIHLAADSRVDASWESILKNNIIGTRNIYECAREYGVKRIIFFSSNHVTGGYEKEEKIKRKISINDPIRPDSCYGVSKLFGEALAREYFDSYGIKSICLRIGSVLKDDDPRNDERNMKTWLSHRDLIQLVEKSLLSKIHFGIYYGVSNNKRRFWDIENARKELGYEPMDDAYSLL
jgi:nucleoside-diphosphate-sugar epimerase